MDDNTLATIEMRLEEATPGPWRITPVIEDPHEIYLDVPSGDPRLDTQNWDNFITVYGCEDVPQVGAWVAKRNAEFIAHSRTDMKLLLDEVRRLQRELAAMSREEAARIKTARDAGAASMRYAAVRALSHLWDQGAANIVSTLKDPFAD